MALPPPAVTGQDVLPGGDRGELVQRGSHIRGQQRTPHPGQVHLRVAGWQVPEGGTELAVAEDVLHRGAVPLPCSTAKAALSGLDTSRLVMMKESA